MTTHKTFVGKLFNEKELLRRENEVLKAEGYRISAELEWYKRFVGILGRDNPDIYSSILKFIYTEDDQ